MTTKPVRKPWHEVVQLRDDVRTGELSLAVFAADLYDVVMQKGQRPVYEHPAEFFALTYPTYSLRELVKDVCARLAGKSDKAYRKLSVNYGGGKTHTLIALRHLVHDPAALPDVPAVREFEAHIGFPAPKARVAALCFDKIDLEKGVETQGADETVRMLRHPWSILAFQLAGADGLRLIHAQGKDEERDTPPAEPLVVELLSRPQKEGLSTLVLLDEVLMYIRVQIETAPAWRGRLVSFFQYLTQAVVKVDRCAMVASLLASDPRKHDDFGNELLRDVSEVFGRQMEEDASPVSKEDVAEVLRRRFFKPESIRDTGVFRPHVTSVVGSIATLDEQTRKERGTAEERYLSSYPFHPDLTEIFYSRWTQLDGFQRTRGILRTFAVALRDAEKWDASPLVGPNVLLAEPGKKDLAEAASELASVASVDTGHRQASGMAADSRGRACQGAYDSVRDRWPPAPGGGAGGRFGIPELSASGSEGADPRVDGAARSSRSGQDGAGKGPAPLGGTVLVPGRGGGGHGISRLGRRPTIAEGMGGWAIAPTLRQMHHDACSNRVSPQLVDSQLINSIEKLKTLTSGASAAGAKVHHLPERPRDIAGRR